MVRSNETKLDERVSVSVSVCVWLKESETRTRMRALQTFSIGRYRTLSLLTAEKRGEFLSLFLFAFLKGVFLRIDMLVSVCDLRLTKMLERGGISEESGEKGGGV